MTLAILPAYAAKPTVVDDDVWFVWSLTSGATTGDTGTWTGDGTILHRDATISWNLMRSKGAPGSTPIGTVVSQVDFMFNTKTGEGNAIIKATMTFTELDKEKNPYGVGTLECTAVAKLTAMNSKWPLLVPGYGSGFIVSTHGTDDFENAKLTADLLFCPIPPTGTTMTQGIFFGIHQYLNGEGTIVYHNPGK